MFIVLKIQQCLSKNYVNPYSRLFSRLFSSSYHSHLCYCGCRGISVAAYLCTYMHKAVFNAISILLLTKVSAS